VAEPVRYKASDPHSIARRDALLALVKAEHIAAEELAESPRVAELIDDIEALNRRTRLPGLRELRQRLYG
jgi:hypothetical protein